MCGLVGVAGDIGNQEEKVFKQLLVLDSLRGEDSTGVAFVNKFTSGVSVAKQIGDPFNLFNDRKFDRKMNEKNKVLLGHNRYATVGGVSRQTAHPFEFDTLVGAHNGTLSSKFKLLNHLDFKVDSENLYHHIEEHGLNNAINQLGSAGNAWSLVWWDKEAMELNFLRNKERPMFMCRSENGKTLFWASEAWMLSSVLFRNGIKRGDIFETEEDMHYSLHIDNKAEMGKPRVVRVAAPPAVVYQNPQNNSKPKHIEPAKQTQLTLVNTAKGEADPKKAQSGVGLASAAFYTKSKGITFELLSVNTDSNGSRYLSLFDLKEPYIDIRLYPRKDDHDLFDMCGTDIIGDISGYDTADKKATRGYYKVGPDTISRIPEPEETLADHRGTLITYTEFKQQYSSCAWCSGNVDPEQKFRFTTAGECICKDCVDNPEVIEYTNLI